MAEDIEILRERRKHLWQLVKRSHDILMRSRKLTHLLEQRYNHDEKEYEKCDYALSEIDGRLARVEAAKAAAENNGKLKHRVPTIKDPTEQYLTQFANASPEEQEKMLAQLRAKQSGA